MLVTPKDKKIVLEYLKKAERGMRFEQILSPPPEPVNEGWGMSIRSVRKVVSDEDALFEFWEELKRTGIIRPMDKLNPDWFVLTEKGRRLAEADDFDLSTAEADVEALIRDAQLKAIVLPLLQAQRFADAVFAAFKHLEERVRMKAGEPSDTVGAALMTKALHHERGTLKVPACHTISEEEGVFMLFKGAIQLLKNPSSHRTVEWSDTIQAVQAVLFADFLLGLLGAATTR